MFWKDLIKVSLYEKCSQSRFIKGDNCRIFARGNVKTQKKLHSDCITCDFTFLLQGKSYIKHDLCGNAQKTIWNSSQQIHNQRKVLG